MFHFVIHLLGVVCCTLGLMTSALASVSVSPSGAAMYSIPIEAPPGVNGMTPQLALSYNSQGGNGQLGMGWGISGLSAITRCPQTVAQDGKKTGITLTNTDRFCLDGQRLVNVVGAYGAHGTQYRTEIESFTKVVSYSNTGGGTPLYFIAWTKDGRTIQYGGSAADIRVNAQGKTTPLLWSVRKITDRSGNYIYYSYGIDNTRSSFRLLNAYGYNKNAVPLSRVQFVYDVNTTTADRTSRYVTGSKIQNVYRLTTAISYTNHGGWKATRKYKLAYGVAGVATGRSRLASIQECDGAGTNCQPAHTFDWQDGANKYVNMRWSGHGVS